MYCSEDLRDMREYLVELSDPPVMRNGDGKLKCLEMLFYMLPHNFGVARCDQLYMIVTRCDQESCFLCDHIKLGLLDKLS